MAFAKLDLLVNSSPAKAWAVVGKFDSPAKWHPFVEEVALSKDGKQRTLYLRNGQEIVERLTLHDDQAMSYHYQLVESGMPVQFCSFQMQVYGMGDQAHIVWSADFDPVDGVSEEEATAMVERMLHSAEPGLVDLLG